MTDMTSCFLRWAPKALLTGGVLFLMTAQINADGNIVDKVYHPYVDSLEREIELRSIFQDVEQGSNESKQLHQFSVGKSFGQSFFGEVYLVGVKSQAGGFDLEAFELELKWQLTEQGEYSADWGLLFEYEQEFNQDAHEFTTGLLIEKEFGRWSGTGNLLLIQEWGSDIKDEFETAVALQARYRYTKAFEPALELYAGQDSAGIGPVAMGSAAVGIRKSLHWEAGVIFGLGDNSPDSALRFLLEYEF